MKTSIVRADIIRPLLAATLALAIAFTFGCEEKSSGKAEDNPKPAEEAATEPKAKEAASCKGGGKGVGKLLECITFDDGTSQKFEYDKQNRLVKFSSITITYNSDDLVTVDTVKFVRKGNTITGGKNTLTLNKDGYIAKQEYDNSLLYTYQYRNSNLAKSNVIGSVIVYNKYDNKKNPFSNCTTPKWLLQYLIDRFAADKNNSLGYSYEPKPEEGVTGGSYDYKYDSDGFPTEKTTYTEEGPITTHYTYRGGTTTR